MKLKIKDYLLLSIPIYGLYYRYENLYKFRVSLYWEIYQLLISPILLGWLFLKFIGYNINF